MKIKNNILNIEGVRVGHLKKVEELGLSYYKVYARYKGHNELLVSVDNLTEAKDFAEFHHTKQRWADALLYADCFLAKSIEDRKKIREDYLAENFS